MNTEEAKMTEPEQPVSPTAATLARFVAMAEAHGFDNLVLIGLGPDRFEYLYQAPNTLAAIGLMECVKAKLTKIVNEPAAE